MPVDANILNANSNATAKLETLVGKLTDADYARDLGGGWNVGAALAHASFWDRRAVKVLERWAREGTPYREQDDDILNECLLDEWLALGTKAGRLAVDAAKAVDATIASLPDRVSSVVLGRGIEFLIERHNHRLEHVMQIEAVLG